MEDERARARKSSMDFSTCAFPAYGSLVSTVSRGVPLRSHHCRLRHADTTVSCHEFSKLHVPIPRSDPWPPGASNSKCEKQTLVVTMTMFRNQDSWRTTTIVPESCQIAMLKANGIGGRNLNRQRFTAFASKTISQERCTRNLLNPLWQDVLHPPRSNLHQVQVLTLAQPK